LKYVSLKRLSSLYSVEKFAGDSGNLYVIITIIYRASACIHECTARYWYIYQFRPSVCPSHAGIVSKLFNLHENSFTV